MSKKWMSGWAGKMGGKCLAMAITSVLLAGSVQLPAMAANTYEDWLTGREDDREDVLEDGDMLELVSSNPYKVIYDLQDGTTFNTAMGAIVFQKTDGIEGVINVEGGSGTLNLHNESDDPSGYYGTAPVVVMEKQFLTINGNINGTQSSAGYSAGGLSVNRGGTGQGEKSGLTVNGNVTFWGNSDNPEKDEYSKSGEWGVQAKRTDGNFNGYYGSRWAPAGVSLNMPGGSYINLNGDVKIAVRGNGLVTDPYYANIGGVSDYDTSVINANKGDVTIYTPKSADRGYNALASYGGTINVNWENGTPGSHNVVLKGNIIALKVWELPAGSKFPDSGADAFYRSGRVNVALTTENSSWTGLVSNDGKAGAGEVNIALQNGAQWNHLAYSKGDTIDTRNLPYPSNDGHYGLYVPTSFVQELRGGASEDKAGVIFQNDKAAIDIKEFSGNVKVVYKHDNQGADLSDYQGGDVKIGKALAGSGIVLVTDNGGIDPTDKDAVTATLKGLAGKLYYGAAATGETNLSGKVEIAEGLTMEAISRNVALGNLDYDKANGGQAKLVEGSVEMNASDLPTGAVIAPETLRADRVGEAAEEVTTGRVIAAMYSEADSTKEAPAKVDLVGHELKLTATASANVKRYETVGAYVDSGKHIEVFSSTGESGPMTIGTVSQGAMKAATAVKVMDNGSFHVAGSVKDLTIDGISSRGSNVYGLNTKGAGSEIRIDAPVAIRNISSGTEIKYEAPAAVLAEGAGSKIVLSKDFTVSDVKGAAFYAKGANSSILVGGGSVDTLEKGTDKKNFLARAEGANSVVKINVRDDENGIKAGKLTATGDVWVKNSSARVDMNLDKSGSTWDGIVAGDGSFNLTLKNGATWTTTRYNDQDPESMKVASLTGGADMNSAGVIMAQHDKALDVADYSGSVKVLYAHDSAAPTTIKGGDVKIAKAAKGSAVTLVTDNAGITMTDSDSVNGVLDALAGKLFYTGFTTGEKNLTGKVVIAEGLTASSVSKKAGDITFKAENGQGSYVVEDLGPVTTGAIVKSETLKSDRTAFNDKFLFESGNYVSALYSESRNTTKQKPMVVDLNGSNLTLKTESDRKIAATLYVGSNTYIDIKNPDPSKKLVISTVNNDTTASNAIRLDGNAHLTVEGPVDIQRSLSKGAGSNGIYIGQQASEAVFNGPVKIRDVDGKRFTGLGINTSGIQITGSESKIIVNGPVDIAGVRGSGLRTNGADTLISVGGGSIIAEKDEEKKSNFYAVRVDKGTINVNMKDGQAGDQTTVIEGDMFVTGEWGKRVKEYTGGQTYDYSEKGDLNVALTDKDSKWTGVLAYEEYRDVFGEDGSGGFSQKSPGNFRLHLQNGATWTNEAQGHITTTTVAKKNPTYSGSFVTELTAGASADKAGNIFQQDERAITVDKFSGHANVFYAHEEGAPATIKGGNFKVRSAAEGSAITLVTDNSGIAMDDKAGVNSVLNALAGKLYYGAYTEGEKNLTGKVSIAEGLTASSASLRLEDISFKDEDGQGQYIATEEPGGGEELGETPVEPEEPVGDFHTTSITGETGAEDQKAFGKAGIAADGAYRFNEDTTLTAKEAANVVDAKADVKIDAAGHTLTMNQEGRTESTNLISNDKGKNIEITADKLVLDNRGTNARAEGIHLANMNGKGTLTVNGDTEITSVGKGYALGIYSSGNSTVTMNGKVKMNNGEDWAVNSNGGSYFDASAIYAAGNLRGMDGAAEIVLNDDIDLKVNANGLYANIGGATIDAKGGSIELNKGTRGDYSALMASNGTVNMNVAKDGSGNVTGADSHKVTIKGNVTASTSAVNGMDKKGAMTRVNLGLSTADSSLTGVVVNQFPAEGKKSGDVTSKGETNLYLENGATWNNEMYGKVSQGWGAPAFEGSKVTSLTGGSDASKAGVIFQKDEKDITIGNYAGHTRVFFGHEAAGSAVSAMMVLRAAAPGETVSAPVDFKGGDIKIGHAAEGSAITLVTDNAGLDMEDKASIDSTLNALAGKLYYSAYTEGERNLEGKVEIAEGLTASSASLRLEEMSFKDENGQGQYIAEENPGSGEEPGGSEVDPGTGGEEPGGSEVDPGTGGEEPGGSEVDPGTGGEVKPGEGGIEYGDKETAMMRGTKTAMASTALMWRNSNNDLHQRLGDLRLAKEENGVWAKYQGGKISTDNRKMTLNNSYKGISVGYDVPAGGNWTVGGAVTKLDGDTTFTGGNSDNKEIALSAYGTMLQEDGQYLDLVMSRSRLETDFRVMNDMGHKLEGDYKTRGTMFSAEYGKRFVKAHGVYVDPSVQLAVGKIKGQSYSAASDLSDGKGGFKSMHVDQEGFTSAVGRLGISVGKQADNYNAFAKLILAHEFSGGFDSTFSADGEVQNSKTHLDLKDTWCEFELGGSAKVSDSTYLYGTFARSFAGDVTNKWRVDAGVRFSF